MTAGPCTPYTTKANWQGNPLLCGSEVADDETWSAAASDLLYVLLGRQFPGACTATVRPVRRGGDCCDPSFSRALLGGCGCGSSPIPLHLPVREITSIKVDGVELVDSETWYLRDGYLLERVDGDWPASQNLALPDTEVGTFSITYGFGPVTPDLVVKAADEYAVQLWLVDNPGTGKTPLQGVDTVSRQGMSLSARQQQDALRTSGPSLPNIMSAIAAYNPRGERLPPDLWSPDDDWDLIIVTRPRPA